MKQLYTDEGHIVQKSGHDTGRNPHRVRPGALRSMGQSFLAILISLSMALSLTPMGAIAQDPTGAAAPTEAPATADTSAAASDDSPSAAQSGQGTTASSASGSKASSSSASSSSGKSSSGKAASDTGGKSSSDDKKESATPKSTEGATPTPTDAPDEDKKPAASKTASAGSVTVTVEVGEGVFAEGWTLSASQASTESAQSAIGDPDVQVVAAIDLIVRDKDGNEIGLPAGKTAKVTFSGANAPSDNVAVYRLVGSTQKVNTLVANANRQEFDADKLDPTFVITAKVAEEAGHDDAAQGTDAAAPTAPTEGAEPTDAAGADSAEGAADAAPTDSAAPAVVYHVTFHDLDNSTVLQEKSVTVNEGEKTGKVALDDVSVTPQDSGQVFMGWSTEPGATKAIADAEMEVSSDIDLYPVFTTCHWITFDENDGDANDASHTDSVCVPKGEKTVAPADPTRPDYTFGGWYRDTECTDPFFFGEKLRKDITLYAKWTPEKPAVTLHGNANGVTVDVEAPEGALPEGAKMTVTAVSSATVMDAVESATGQTSPMVQAVDITFTDKDGGKIEPAKDIKVSLKSSTISKAEDPSVVHIKDSGAGELVNASTSGSKMSFSSQDFSIYVIVGDEKIVTVNFYDGDGNFITSEYVRKVDGEVQDLYDPSFVLEKGESFYGWATTQDATEGKDIDDLNVDFKKAWDSYDAETAVSYYAVVKQVYVVNFNRYNDEGDLVVLDTQNIPLDQADKTISIPGDLGSDLGSEFEGWLSQDGTLYEENDTYTVTDHTDFYLKQTGRYWLVFDSNAGGPGSGATYTPPQLIFGEGVVTEKPADPTRTGYTFLGWNTKADGTGTWWSKTDDPSVDKFGGTLPDDTTLYAQWEGDETTYYVLYWRQNSTDEAGLDDSAKTYTYAGSREGTARTGDTVSTSSEDTGKADTAGYEHYDYNSTKSDTSVTVGADGTTTLNVYYDLEEYTMTFQAYGYTYTETTGNSGTQYGLVDGEYVRIYRGDGGTWYTTRELDWGGWSYSNPYSGTRYTRNNYPSWQTIKTITALYNHNISDQFPIVGSNGVTYSGYVWEPQGTTVYGESDVPAAEVMPAQNVTFHAKEYGQGTTIHMYYYTEVLPGVTGDVTYQGKSFEEHQHVQINAHGDITSTENEDFYDITGFDQLGSDPAFVNGRVELNRGNDYTIKFYYTRSGYNINFISVSDGRQEFTRSGIAYEQSLSEYASVTPTNGAEGYVFVGWYTDAACAPGTEFDFSSKMPAKDLTLYAKWESQRCRIVLDPNAAEGTYTFANNQALSFRLDYNELISDANITGSAAERTGYLVDGWYTEDGTLWNFDTPVNANAPGVDADYQSSADWANNTYGDNDGAHDNVKNFLKLKANWKLNVDTNSVYVIYKVGDEYCTYASDGSLQTGIPVDSSHYVLQDGVTSVIFQTQPAPTNYDNNYAFTDWALLDADGVKTDTSFKAGSQATVGEEYFKTETITDDSGASATIRYVVLEAEFDPIENRATMVVFDGNGGKTSDGHTTVSQSYLVNKTFGIPGGDTFTRTGYNFTKWTTGEDGTGTEFTADTTVAADNLEGTAWNAGESKNIVYAQWEPIHYTVKFDANGGTGSMADMTFAYDEEKTLTANAFARSDYTFLGWSTDPDATTATYTDEQSVKNLTDVDGDTITLYAVWEPYASYTIHHYLKGTTIQVADDETGKQPVGTEVTATPVSMYRGKALTDDSYDPSQTITLVADDTANVITVYYTLPLTITALGDSKVYDGTALTKNGYTSEGLLEGDTIDSVTITGSRTDVGTAANVASDAVVKRGDDVVGYYDIDYVDGTLEVTKATATVTIVGNNVTETYDGNEKSASDYTVSIVASGGTYTESDFTFSGTAEAARTNAGTTPMGLAKSQFTNTNTNYDVTFEVTDGYVTITPAAITIKAVDKTKVYDNDETTDPELTATVTGVPEKGAAPAYSLSREAGQGVGGYAISVTAEAASNPNYTVSVEGGTFTITPAAITIKAKDQSYVYNGAKQGPGDTVYEDADVVAEKVSVEGLVGDDELVQIELDGQAQFVESPSEVTPGSAVVKNGEDVVTGNYTITYVPGKLTIKPRPVTFTGKSETKEYTGSTITISTVDVTPTTDDAGLVAGDAHNVEFSASGVEASDTPYAGTITAKEAVVITAGGEDVTENYNITTTPGALTITKTDEELTVSLEGKSFEYDATAHALPTAATTNAATGTTTIEYSKDGETWTSDLSSLTATNVADSCTIQVRATNPNYKNTATGSATLTISPKGVTVTADAAQKQFATDDPAFTASVVGNLNGDGIAYTVTRPGAGTDEAVGSYPEAIVAAGEANQGNYTVTYVPATFTIVENTGALTLTAKDGGGEYTGSPYGLKDVSASLAAATIEYKVGDGEWTTTAPTVTNVADSQNATISVRATLDGYTPAQVDGLSIVVTPKAVTVKVEDKTVQYNGSEQYGNTECTFTNVVDGQTASIGYTAAKGTLVGTYDNGAFADDFKVMADGADVTSNYTLGAQTAGKLTITPAEPKGQLSVTKTVTSKPADGTAYKPGETITYAITVENTGTPTLTNVKIEDPLTGGSWKVETLASGAKAEYTTTYTVTQADADAGKVTNTATATGKDPSGNDVTGDASATVTTEAQVVYTITYKLDGGTYNGSTEDIVETYAPNTEITIHEAPTRDGYKFDYWEGSRYNPGEKYTVNGDHTFVAQWVPAKTAKSASTTKSTPKSLLPRTGDSLPILGIALLGVGLLLVVGVRLSRRKQD